MNKHQIFTYTSPLDIQYNVEGDKEVTVYWQVQFDRSLDNYLNKRKYQHDFRMFKQGVGRLVITIGHKQKEISEDSLLAYAECLALKHLVSTRGLNVFGFTEDKMTIRRDHLHFYVSQPLSVDLIDREGKEETLMKIAIVGPSCSMLAAYVFGATISHRETNTHLKGNEEFEFYNSTTDMLIKSSDTVRTDLADLIIDYRTCQEFMLNDFTRYTVEAKGMEYSRVYNTIYELLYDCKEIQYEGNAYVQKTQELFGQDCVVAFNDSLNYAFQLKPHGKEYLVYGLKKYLAPALKADMAAAGFGDNFCMPTAEEIEASRQRRKYHSS